MEPAKSIIQKIGGVAVASEVTGVHRTRVYGWQRERNKSGGTGGIIPQRHHRAILDYAQKNSIRLKAEDFLPPRANGAAA